MPPKPGRYNPTEPPEPQMTPAQFHNQQAFFFDQVERFKKLFEGSILAKYIIMAGVSGVVLAVIELVRLLWLAARYICRF